MSNNICTLTRLGDRVACIKLSRPNRKNALNGAMLKSLATHLDTIQAERDSLGCVIIIAEGDTFCAGADLKDTLGLGRDGPEGLGSILQTHFHPVFTRMAQLEVPILVALNGPCVGIGVMLAIMADIVIACPEAYLKLHFSRIGLIPDGGATFWLPRVVGRHKTMQMILLDAHLDMDEALQCGFIFALYPRENLHEQACQIATTIANGPALANRTARHLVWQSFEQNTEQQANSEAQAQDVCGRSHDFSEGVLAFLQKRQPSFNRVSGKK